MQTAVVLSLCVGFMVGAVIARRREPPSPVHAHLPYPAVIEHELQMPARRTEPMVTTESRHLDCPASVERAGTPLAKLPDEVPGERWWRVAVSARTCVLAVWSERDVLASWNDGASFEPIVPSSSKLVGVDVGDDGTIFVIREDFTLVILHPDGRTITRTLAFRGRPLARGRWLVIAGGSPSISDDEGASWRQLEWQHGGDLRVLSDGTIVAHADVTGEVCGDKGCDGPTELDLESHLDGRPWTQATPAHVRAIPPPRGQFVALEPRSASRWDVTDSHGLPIHAERLHILRYLGKRGWRLLYTGAP
jgi:hypothetical protein